MTEQLTWNVGQDDPHDHYPWHWTPYTDEFGGPDTGFISTPNGTRSDGDEIPHTYWSVAGELWEPHGRLICALVNAWAHERFGTPMHPDDELFGPDNLHDTAPDIEYDDDYYSESAS